MEYDDSIAFSRHAREADMARKKKIKPLGGLTLCKDRGFRRSFVDAGKIEDLAQLTWFKPTKGWRTGQQVFGNLFDCRILRLSERKELFPS